MRTDPELRARIEKAAEDNGVSLTQEVERRLRDSFGEEATAIRPELYERLRSAAARRGFTVQQEIERRVEDTFRDEDQAGGQDVQAFARAIGTVIPLIESQTGQKWQEDFRTWAAVKAAVERLALQWQPERAELPLEQELAGVEDKLFESLHSLRTAQVERGQIYEAHPQLRLHKARDADGVAAETWERIKELNATIRRLRKEVEALEVRRNDLAREIVAERHNAAMQGAVTAFEAIDSLGFKDRMVLR